MTDKFQPAVESGEASHALVEVADVSFSYARPVLQGLSLKVKCGDLATVIGPNGAGKSTLLRIILGALSPESGSVRLQGRDIKSMSRRDIARVIGYVPQESSVRFPLTALEYVLQGRFAQGRLMGFESDRDLAEARRAMDLTGSTEFSCRLMHELSGGERQRVTLARAIASDPKLLVLDEPVANLDISYQVKTLDLVRRLTAGGRMGALVVTHELNLASEFATTVVLLKSGRLLASGPPAQVMNNELLEELFETELLVDTSPVSGAPRVTMLAPSGGSDRDRHAGI